MKIMSKHNKHHLISFGLVVQLAVISQVQQSNNN